MYNKCHSFHNTLGHNNFDLLKEEFGITIVNFGL